MDQQPQKLTDRFSDCYLSFNAYIDRLGAQNLLNVVQDVWRNGFGTVHLLLSSGGGQVDHAYYLFAGLQAMPLKYVTWNIGGIQSAANVLFSVGHERYVTPPGTFHFHRTWFEPPTQVTAEYLRSKMALQKAGDLRSAEIISDRCGVSVRTVLQWQARETVMDAEQSVAAGVAHAVRAPKIPPTAFFQQVVV